MGRSCSAKNCKNRHGKLRKDGKALQFHQFPLQKPDLLKKWIKAVKREDWKPTKASLLCGDHFLEDDYVSSACCYLRPNAVPSVFDFSSHPQKVQKRRKKQKLSPVSNQLKCRIVKAVTVDHPTSQSSTLQALVENNTESRDEELTPDVKNHTLPEQNPSLISNQSKCLDVKPAILDHVTPQRSTLQAPIVGKNTASSEISPLFVSNQLKCPDVNATTLDHTTPQCSTQASGAGNNTALPDGLTPNSRNKMLQKKVKMLQEKLRRRDQKIAKLESMLFTAQRCCSKSRDTSQMLKDSYGELPCELLINILSNKSKKSGGQRYTKSMKEFAASLYYNSPSTYNFLRTKLNLPSPSYIRSKDAIRSGGEDKGAYEPPVIVSVTKE